MKTANSDRTSRLDRFTVDDITITWVTDDDGSTNMCLQFADGMLDGFSASQIAELQTSMQDWMDEEGAGLLRERTADVAEV